MSEENTHYWMSVGPYVQIERIQKICVHLDSKGYGVSDLYFLDSKGFEVNGVKYDYEEMDKIPVKENGLEKRVQTK